jgi:hypothetical protein
MTDTSLPCVADENGNYHFTRSVTLGELITFTSYVLNDKPLEVVFHPDQDPERKAFLEDVNLLIDHASGSNDDDLQCTMFLLSLWNGKAFKVNLQELLFANTHIHAAMLRVLQYLYTHNVHLVDFIDENQVQRVLEAWRLAYTPQRRKPS